MKLSVITVNRNNREGLARTLKSVAVQSFRDLELIVIDGLSNDGSIDEIKTFSSYISYWISEPDNGVYNAMNKGIVKAGGEYLIFLNSGDCFANEKVLEELFGLNYNQDILYGKISLNGEIISYPDKLTFYNIRWGVLPHQASFIKRELFGRHGLYNEKYRIASDWEFWIKAIILNSCSYKYVDMLITYQEPPGLSSVMDCNEGSEILRNHIPDRILEDYDRLKELESESGAEKMKFLQRHPLINNIVLLSMKILK
jgi:glycosyltransferase involved in cell wall biosynthesis